MVWVGGNGVARLTFKEGQCIVNLKTEKILLENSEALSKFYEENFTQVKYILQPHINSRTLQGNPFDIRVHARRGANGKFKTISYPRVGNVGGVVSNLAAGGYISPLEPFLRTEYGDDYDIVYNKLKTFASTFPDYYQSFFNDTIFDIGIDVGIQKRGDTYELKVFEAYIQPGTAYIEVEDAINCLEYYRYIAQQISKGLLK